MGNIVWIASYPKSGNTWMRAFIENYVRNPPQPVDINQLFKLSTAESQAGRFQALIGDGRLTTELSSAELCALRPLVQSQIARDAQGSVFVKTHNYLGQWEGQALHHSAVTAGAIYLVRNPLDVVISMARYFDMSIDESIDYLAEEMTGTPNEAAHVPQLIRSWSTHVASWTARGEPSILVLRYEDLLDNALKYFRKVTSFLGLGKDPARLRKAIRYSAFDQLRGQEDRTGFVERHENAGVFFRQGRKSQWRGKLSDAQVKRVIADHREQMERFKYIPAGFGN